MNGNYDILACDQPKGVEGPCEAIIPRWTFDKKSGHCEKFIYGGCKGNANKFDTKIECQTSCGNKGISLLYKP